MYCGNRIGPRVQTVTVWGVSTSDRTLLLLRHAKSDYPDDVVDHERPLARRGVREAGLAADGDHAAIEQMAMKYPTSAIAMLRTAQPWSRLRLRGATLVAFHVPR